MGATDESKRALTVSEVRYSYGKTRAVDGVSFGVRSGEIFGLLGPNGAGKTTTISMISGLLPPESGQVLLFGEATSDRSGRARGRMGVVPQEIALYEELTAHENLQFWGRLYGLTGRELADAVQRALDQVGLADRAKERVSKLSGGLKRRLNLAVGLVHGPDLLLLDEPTVGIDPQARLRILDVVKAQAASGRAVLYTSHYLEEAEQICDRLAIIDHGRVLAEGSVQDLRALVGEGPVVSVRGEAGAEPLQALASRCRGVTLLSHADGVASFSAADAEACSDLVRTLFSSGARFDDLRVQEPNLQSLFLKLTGRELRD
ncbi:MAG TPA: ABC transporter ATP-binding protein [Candidatus Polarisedimenticolia bacterium]|nr:ABC transporter ATP-binding protein [Candidatus Polarisedimenticolia bacterium]